MTTRFLLLDYGVGNIKSVARAFERQGANVVLSRNPHDVAQADVLILPGQGAFPEAMSHLRQAELIEPVKAHIQADKPFFGICLGFQVLFDYSEENEHTPGLCVFKGAVKRFPIQTQSGPLRVPHVGWNPCHVHQDPMHLLKDGEHYYFTHSYFVDTFENDLVCTTTMYSDLSFTSSIQKGNLFACQFHPEKSGPAGQRLIETFVKRFS